MKNGEQPAFPTITYNDVTGQPNGHLIGLTKRELFAKDITSALVKSWDKVNTNWIAEPDVLRLCKHAIEIADELLKQLENS